MWEESFSKYQNIMNVGLEGSKIFLFIVKRSYSYLTEPFLMLIKNRFFFFYFCKCGQKKITIPLFEKEWMTAVLLGSLVSLTGILNFRIVF